MIELNLLSLSNQPRMLRRMHGRLVREAVGALDDAVPLRDDATPQEVLADLERELVRSTLAAFEQWFPGVSPALTLGFLVLPRAALRLAAKRLGARHG